MYIYVYVTQLCRTPQLTTATTGKQSSANGIFVHSQMAGYAYESCCAIDLVEWLTHVVQIKQVRHSNVSRVVSHPEKMPELAENALCHRFCGVCPPDSEGVAAVLCLCTAPATAKATAPSATTGAMAAELSGTLLGATAAALAALAFSLSLSASGMAMTSPLGIMRMDPICKP